MLELLKQEADITYTENGAVTYSGSGSACLDLFATIGALRSAAESEITSRFEAAYKENAELAVKLLFFARDIRGGLGERKTFRVMLKWLADNRTLSAEKNLRYIPEYGRYDDILTLFGTGCEKDALSLIRELYKKDTDALENGQPVSLLGKWLPSVNTSSAETVKNAKKIIAFLGISEARYRKTLSALRAKINIIENYLRLKDYTFDYEKQPSRAMLKYRAAFLRSDGQRYSAYLDKVARGEAVMHTGTLTPYDIAAPCIANNNMGANERTALNAAWLSCEDFTNGENALAVVDGSGSMYGGNRPMPAAVAQSLGIYFAEHNKGAFHGHFITFSASPRLVEIKGADIYEKVRYCMDYDECANTDLQKVFDLILRTAVKNNLPPEELPSSLYIISDMEFDYCAENASLTNFQNAEAKFKAAGYKLPRVIFWNVESRNRQQQVGMNEQGVVLVSGSSPRVFEMIKHGTLSPYAFMLDVLSGERYACITA